MHHQQLMCMLYAKRPFTVHVHTFYAVQKPHLQHYSWRHSDDLEYTVRISGHCLAPLLGDNPCTPSLHAKIRSHEIHIYYVKHDNCTRFILVYLTLQ